MIENSDNLEVVQSMTTTLQMKLDKSCDSHWMRLFKFCNPPKMRLFESCKPHWMRLNRSCNLIVLKIDWNGVLGKNLLGKGFIRPIYKLTKSITDTNRKVRELKT